MKIRHLVSTRFLLFDFFGNGRIFDDGYKKNVTNVLMNGFISTLKNQTDDDYECAIITNPRNVEYVKSLSFPIKVKVFTYDGIIADIKSSLNNYDYIISTVSDYDDFFHKDNLKIIKQSINSSVNFKMFGFLNGATLIKGEDEPHLFSPSYIGTTGFFTCCASIIYSTKISFTNEFPFIVHEVAKKHNGNHPNWKHIIEAEYKNWGLHELDADFFDYDKDDKTTRFIWTRQPQSYTTIKLEEEHKPLHLSDVIVSLDLKNDFGYGK